MDRTVPVFNFNIGILGHVDSGKTSLAKAISTTASTAAFDKNPQSQERGITLDLGFSCHVIDMPMKLSAKFATFEKFEKLQFTFVDCPGHASLIRTVIAGASIIDMVILVIDVTKGMQTQTAECLILGEITCPTHMIIVLNKLDLIEENVRVSTVDKMTKRLRKTLETTSYRDAQVVAVSAATSNGLQQLIDTLVDHVYEPKRSGQGPFLFAVDHCFAIKGQGSVLTGTILSGTVKLNDNVEISTLKEVKKVKSMQMYRKPIQSAQQGDRIGLCVTQFDAKLFERGLVSQPGILQSSYAVLVSAQKISYYKQQLTNKAKFHVSIGHETVMAKCTFFGCDPAQCNCKDAAFNFDQDYPFQESYLTEKDKENKPIPVHQYALLEFEHPILCPPSSLYIASKLDIDIHTNTCRLAFHGKLLHSFTEKTYVQTCLPAVKVYKCKQKQGVVERLADDFTVIVHSLLKKETTIDLFTGLKAQLSTGEHGVIEGGFGQSGKVKVRVSTGFGEETAELLKSLGGGKRRGAKTITGGSAGGDAASNAVIVTLNFKRYVYDPKKRMIQ